MNLLNISLGTISELFKYSDNVGYSDHSMDPSTSLMAAMAGAQTIEKHITLDKNYLDQIIFIHYALKS